MSKMVAVLGLVLMLATAACGSDDGTGVRTIDGGGSSSGSASGSGSTVPSDPPTGSDPATASEPAALP